MPFKSKAQWRKCRALKARGKAGTWDCGEWTEKTRRGYKGLPEYSRNGLSNTERGFVLATFVLGTAYLLYRKTT